LPDLQDRIDPRDSADRIEPTLAAEAIEPTDRTEPTEATDSIEPAEPSERTEPAEPIDKIDAFDPMQRNESCEPIDHREPWLSLMPGILARRLACGNAHRRPGAPAGPANKLAVCGRSGRFVAGWPCITMQAGSVVMGAMPGRTGP
jgi:hypothetical protein